MPICTPLPATTGKGKLQRCDAAWHCIDGAFVRVPFWEQATQHLGFGDCGGASPHLFWLPNQPILAPAAEQGGRRREVVIDHGSAPIKLACATRVHGTLGSVSSRLCWDQLLHCITDRSRPFRRSVTKVNQIGGNQSGLTGGRLRFGPVSNRPKFKIQI